MTLRRATITSIGRSLPYKVLSNHDLEAMVDTTDAWILARTGIRERRIVEEGTGASELGEGFGERFDQTTYLSDGAARVIDVYRELLHDTSDVDMPL